MSALADASALFELFVRSDWTSIHVAGGGIELFASRSRGHANPMLGPIRDEAPAATIETAVLRAPHIGTLVDLAPIGSVVGRGGRYGTIEVLGERHDLLAAQGGTVRRHGSLVGDLVEYDQPLAAIG